MRITENRGIASVALALCVVVSVFGFGGSALKKEQKNIMNVFNDGTDTTLSVRHSADAYMDQCAESALKVALEGETYGADAALIEEVRALAGQITDGKDTSARFEAFSKLINKVDSLDNAVYGMVSSEEYTTCKLAYNDFKSYSDMLQRDGYNDQARAYNRFLDGFPSALVADIVGAGKMGTYGG